MMNIENELDKLSYDELIKLNGMVVDRIKSLRAARNKIEIQQFSLGNAVQFWTDEGELISGIVIKKNKKTVGIVTEEGDRWNVSPALLEKVSERKENLDDQQVINFPGEKKA